MKDGTSAFPPQVGIGYEAFWLRDYIYTLEGSVDSYSDKELLDAGRLFIKSMRADGAGVDCVKFDGQPIYKPGFGTLGANPVADGSQFLAIQRQSWRILRMTIGTAAPMVLRIRCVCRVMFCFVLFYMSRPGAD